jgi:hypothetical protein
MLRRWELRLNLRCPGARPQTTSWECQLAPRRFVAGRGGPSAHDDVAAPQALPCSRRHGRPAACTHPRRDPPLRRSVQIPAAPSARVALCQVLRTDNPAGVLTYRAAAVGAPCSLAELGAAQAPRPSAEYAAFVVEPYARRILGWRVTSTMGHGHVSRCCRQVAAAGLVCARKLTQQRVSVGVEPCRRARGMALLVDERQL